MQKEVSVIIAAYNEEDYIGECLESLLRQTHPSYELIVVDDGSTDRTPEIAQQLGVRLIKGDHKGPGLARNKGAAESNGDILVFLDADMSFDPDFLQKLIDPMKDNGVAGTFSKEEYVANWNNPWARCWNINLGLPDRKRHPADYPDCDAVFRAIRRQDFVRANGYDDMGYSEDMSLSRKLNKFAVKSPGAICYHHNPSTLREVFQSARWFGRGDQITRNLKTLLRHTIPISLKNGLGRSLKHKEPRFPIFKIVYDYGVFCGMVSRMLNPKAHTK